MLNTNFLIKSFKSIFSLIMSVLISISAAFASGKMEKTDPPLLLTDPFLQLPTSHSVRVVWFTEYPGTSHFVEYGNDLELNAYAWTKKMSKLREDQLSYFGKGMKKGQVFQKPTQRNIWRHEALVTNLKPGVKVPYRVISVREDSKLSKSKIFTLQAKPIPGTPLNILLTSDHQLKSMTAANLQKAKEIVPDIDAVFMAGDLVNIADRATEWFDDNRGGAFFPCLQGKASKELGSETEKRIYRGGEIIQYAPLFPVIGNHEVMGRELIHDNLNTMANKPLPLEIGRQFYEQVKNEINPDNDAQLKQKWIQDNTFNTITYEEIFTLPESETGGETYYSILLGDIYLISLYATRIWKTPKIRENLSSKYQEAENILANQWEWGYGSFIFEPIKKGSNQYVWLKQELNKPEFKTAKYKIVMLHHPLHSLGENSVPPFTDPEINMEKNPDGTLTKLSYKYPKEKDYLIQDLEPLLVDAGIDLVLNGHSHLWNRFKGPGGIHYLETSNVGNTYGAFIQGGKKRWGVPDNISREYDQYGDPYGLKPISPNLKNIDGNNPYIASNDYTVFTIFNTKSGLVTSYAFNTKKPDSEVIRFDEFSLDK